MSDPLLVPAGCVAGGGGMVVPPLYGPDGGGVVVAGAALVPLGLAYPGTLLYGVVPLAGVVSLLYGVAGVDGE